MVPDAIEALDALKDFDERDWDSYGAEPVSRNALYNARLLVWAARGVAGAGTRFDPVAGPLPDGGVTLLWRGPGTTKIVVRVAPIIGAPPSYVVLDDLSLKATGLIDDPKQLVEVIRKYALT
jgi:hypothetical protein